MAEEHDARISAGRVEDDLAEATLETDGQGHGGQFDPSQADAPQGGQNQADVAQTGTGRADAAQTGASRADATQSNSVTGGEIGYSVVKKLLSKLLSKILWIALVFVFMFVANFLVDAIFDAFHKPTESEIWSNLISKARVELDPETTVKQSDADEKGGFSQIWMDKSVDLGTAIITASQVESSFKPRGYYAMRHLVPEDDVSMAEKIEWSSEGALYPDEPIYFVESPGMYVRLWFNVKYASCSFDVKKIYAAMTVGDEPPNYTSISLYTDRDEVDSPGTMTATLETIKRLKAEEKNAKEHPGKIDCECWLCVEGHFNFQHIDKNDTLTVKLGISDEALEVRLPEYSSDADEEKSGEENENDGEDASAASSASSGSAADSASSGSAAGSASSASSASSADVDASGDSISLITESMPEYETYKNDTDNYLKHKGSLYRKNDFGLDGFDQCDHLYEFVGKYVVVGKKKA